MKYIKLIILIFIFIQNKNIASINDTIKTRFLKTESTLFSEKTNLFVMPFCDACGSAGGGSMGFASMLNTNFVGVRYFYQSYQSRNGLYSNSPWYAENYNTVQAWARIPILKKVQLSVLVPFQFHNRENIDGKQNISGLGDITLLGMYQLYQTKKDSTFFGHTLLTGGGIKFPTGKFNETNNTGAVNQSYQVGTGSWDFQLLTEYIIRHKKIGFNTTLNYIIKSENEKYYRYGNQLNYAGTLFYLYEKNDISIAPQLGFAGELYGSNYQHKQELKDTSGDILFSKIGFEIGRKKLSIGANTMLPINQNLAGGNMKANYRWSINLNYSL